MSTNREFQNVQLNIDFAKEIDGTTKLADAVLYSNLVPSQSASSGANTNNIAVSFAKLYQWASDIFTFDPTGTKKIEIKSSALPSGGGNTYSFQEGSFVGSFQVKENQGSWQTIAIHNGLHAGDSTTNPTQAANVRLTKGSVSGDLDDTVELQWNNGTSWLKLSSVALGLLDSNNKILEKYLPSYVDDVIEAYYDNGEFYSDPTTHTSATQLPHESGKIYVDITTSTSYRWGGSSYISITNPIDVFTGATSSTAGVAGIVPAPAAGDEVKFLRGDATWQTINIPSQDAYVLSGAYGSGNKTWVSTLTKNGSTAAGTSTVPTASTSVYGITSLSSATNSSAEDVAATPKAVKAAYDLANGKSTVAVSNLKSSGTKIATITVNGTGNDVYVESMTASTASVAGTRGTVQPPANSMDKYLRGDNTWVNPIDDIGILTLHCTNGTS